MIERLRFLYAPDDGGNDGGNDGVESDLPGTPDPAVAEDGGSEIGETGGNDEGNYKPSDAPKILAQAKNENKTREDLFSYKTLDDYIAAIDELKGKTYIPGEEASEEEVAAYKKAIGAPETAEDYTDISEDFAKVAFEMNLTNEQASTMAKHLDSRLNQLQNTIKASSLETEKMLKEEWGKNYTKNIEHMKKAIDLTTDQVPELKERLRKTGAGNDPVIVKAFAYLGSLFSEEGIPLGESSGGVIDDEEAKLRSAYPSMFK